MMKLKNNIVMKRMKLVFLMIVSLFPAVNHVTAQKIQQMIVHSNGNVLYTTNLSESDSITFPKFNVSNSASGVEINGVVWASFNVNTPGTFASKPEDAGMFYQWNRPVGWSSTDPLINSEGGSAWNSTSASGTSWTTDNDPCPAGWRLPTRNEFTGLLNSGSIWGVLNGINGRFFGNGEERIFFPVVGYRSDDNGALNYVDSRGYYWSSTASGSEFAFYLYFNSSQTSMSDYFRNNGFPVRCVTE